MNSDLLVLIICLTFLVALLFMVAKKLLSSGNIFDFFSRNDSEKLSILRENPDETLEYSVDLNNSRLRIRVKSEINTGNYNIKFDSYHLQLNTEETLFLYEAINKNEI